MQYPEVTMLALVVISFALLLQTSQAFVKTIEVTNGGQLGDWGPEERCPPGTVAKGFDLKVESLQGLGDDTALNGIRLHCARCSYPYHETTITSSEASWGTWNPTVWCPFGFLQSFSLKVEEYHVIGDNTAANNIKFKCSDERELEGEGLSFGHYGEWSELCSNGICGLSTKVQKHQQEHDDTALNNVKFLCCKHAISTTQSEQTTQQSQEENTQQSQDKNTEKSQDKNTQKSQDKNTQQSKDQGKKTEQSQSQGKRHS